jgi:hypothetical protein
MARPPRRKRSGLPRLKASYCERDGVNTRVQADCSDDGAMQAAVADYWLTLHPSPRALATTSVAIPKRRFNVAHDTSYQ